MGKCNDELKTLIKILLGIKIDFYRVSDVPRRRFRVPSRTCISEMALGALIGAGAINRANTII